MAQEWELKNRVSVLKKNLSREPELFPHLADCMLRLGKVKEAAKVLNEGLESHPENALGWTIRGSYYRKIKQPRKAREAFETALRINRDLPRAHQECAELALLASDNDAHVYHLRELNRLMPMDGDIQLQINTIQLRMIAVEHGLYSPEDVDKIQPETLRRTLRNNNLLPPSFERNPDREEGGEGYSTFSGYAPPPKLEFGTPVLATAPPQSPPPAPQQAASDYVSQPMDLGPGFAPELDDELYIPGELTGTQLTSPVGGSAAGDVNFMDELPDDLVVSDQPPAETTSFESLYKKLESKTQARVDESRYPLGRFELGSLRDKATRISWADAASTEAGSPVREAGQELEEIVPTSEASAPKAGDDAAFDADLRERVVEPDIAHERAESELRDEPRESPIMRLLKGEMRETPVSREVRFNVEDALNKDEVESPPRRVASPETRSFIERLSQPEGTTRAQPPTGASRDYELVISESPVVAAPKPQSADSERPRAESKRPPVFFNLDALKSRGAPAMETIAPETQSAETVAMSEPLPEPAAPVKPVAEITPLIPRSIVASIVKAPVVDTLTPIAQTTAIPANVADEPASIAPSAKSPSFEQFAKSAAAELRSQLGEGETVATPKPAAERSSGGGTKLESMLDQFSGGETQPRPAARPKPAISQMSPMDQVTGDDTPSAPKPVPPAPKELAKVAEEVTGVAPKPAQPAPVADKPRGDRIATKTLAELYASQSNWKEAISVYEQLLEKHPGNPAYQARVEELRGKMG